MASLRHRVRTVALQILFELDATDHAPDQVVERQLEDEQLPPDGERFLRRLAGGAWEHRAHLDRIIEEAAPSWPVSQMPGVDKAILRIALYEILIDDQEIYTVKGARVGLFRDIDYPNYPFLSENARGGRMER